jgi:filamentous hemagglutinin family protein
LRKGWGGIVKQIYSFFLYCIALLNLTLVTVSTSLAGIVPDGRTSTFVEIMDSGRPQIQIASPSGGGVSYNSYHDFSVGRVGADFNNTEGTARLIVNEVTGFSTSLIEGDIAVIGRRANFILANENGIKVDGGAFVNMGSIGLTTGKLELYDFNPTPDTIRYDIVLRTNKGLVEIGEKGITGAFNRLDIISKNIIINGEIRNSYDNPNAAVRLITGSSLGQVNSDISPTDDLSDWLVFQGGNETSQDIIVDITPLGSLRSGRIEVVVTDQGAGMRHAGSLYASAGDFIVSTEGKIIFDGARNKINGSMFINADHVLMKRNDSGEMSYIDTGKDTQILTSEFDIDGVEITAGSEEQPGHIFIVHREGTSNRTSEIKGSVNDEGFYQRSKLHAYGSVLLNTRDQALSLESVDIKADASIEISGASIDITSVDIKETRSEINAERGVLHVNASDDLSIKDAYLHGGAAVSIGATNLLFYDSGSEAEKGSQIVSNGGNIELRAVYNLSIDGGDVIALKEVKLKGGGDINISSSNGRQAKVWADNGQLIIETDGKLINRGGYLYGTAPEDEDASTQAVIIKAKQSFQNITPDEEHIAIVFSKRGNISIETESDFVNHGGRIIANGDLSIVADGDIRNILNKVPGTNDEKITFYSKKKKRFFGLLRSKKRGYSIDYGTPLLGDQLSYLIADGDLDIKGRDIISIGGEIAANNGSVHIDAQKRFINQALRVGQLEYSRSCLFLGCRRIAESSVRLFGGNVSASEAIRIVAGESVLSEGGRMVGIDGIEISAPETTIRALENYRIVSRTHGMRSFYGDTYAQVYDYDTGGVLQAVQGNIHIDGNLIIDGGESVTLNGMLEADEIYLLREPLQESPMLDDIHNGIFSFVLR